METWLPLAFLVVAIVGSLAYAALRGRRLWRTVRSMSEQTSSALARVADRAAETERHTFALSGNSERLAAASTRLHTALEELAVLRAAYAEGRGAFSSLRGAVPRK